MIKMSSELDLCGLQHMHTVIEIGIYGIFIWCKRVVMRKSDLCSIRFFLNQIFTSSLIATNQKSKTVSM